MLRGTHTGGAWQGRQTAEPSLLCPAAATRVVRRPRRAVRARHRRPPGTRKEMCAPRGDTVACTRSPNRSRARLLPASSVEHANEVLEALALEIEDAPAQRRQLVVPSTRHSRMWNQLLLKGRNASGFFLSMTRYLYLLIYISVKPDLV